MKRLIVAVGLGLGLVSSTIAGPLTQGIEFTGGENSLASLVLQRAQNIVAEDGVLKLHIAINHAQKLKGYGFVYCSTINPSMNLSKHVKSIKICSMRAVPNPRYFSRLTNARASGCWRDEGRWSGGQRRRCSG